MSTGVGDDFRMAKLKTEFKSLADHLLVVVTGEYDLAEAIGSMVLILDSCKITGLTRVLVDYRRMGSASQATEKVIYAMDVGQQYSQYLKSGGHALKIAYLGAASAVGFYKPGLEIARQQNLPIELFTSEKAAYRWLEIDPPDWVMD